MTSKAFAEIKNIKLMIIGHGRHGKDTVAEILVAETGNSFAASSEICAKAFIYDTLKDEFGYKSAEECFEDRHNHRALWHHLIKLFNYHNKAALSELIFDNCSYYVGCRSREEFLAAKAEGLYDYAIWVDASDRKPLEDESSFDIDVGLSDVIVDNNGTEEDLRVNIQLLAELLATRTLVAGDAPMVINSRNP